MSHQISKVVNSFQPKAERSSPQVITREPLVANQEYTHRNALSEFEDFTGFEIGTSKLYNGHRSFEQKAGVFCAADRFSTGLQEAH